MDNQSLVHSRSNCMYHIVFISKISAEGYVWSFGKEVGEILGKVCRMENVTILEAATLPDHIHMYVSISPKESVAKTVGRIKGKSALMIFDRHPEYRKRNSCRQRIWKEKDGIKPEKRMLFKVQQIRR